MSKYVIRKTESDVAYYLQGLAIGCNAENYKSQTEWTRTLFYAFKTENEEKAQAVINFIKDVIDPELAQQLTVEPVQN